MVVKDVVMPHLRSQRTGQRPAWKSPVSIQNAQQSMKLDPTPVIKVESSTGTTKKYSLAMKPSMSLQYFDEGSEKRLEAAFKSVIKYSLSTGTTDFAEENVAELDRKPINLVSTSARSPNSVSKNDANPRVVRKKKLPSPKAFDGITFSLGDDIKPDLSHFNTVHRCKTCSVSCVDFLDEFCGFPNIDFNMDTDDGVIVDELNGSFHGFDFSGDENSVFYGFEKMNNFQKSCSQLEVSGLRPCSVVLYRVKPCSVVLHRLKYSLYIDNVRHEKNVSHSWQFPARNGKLVRKAPKKQSGTSRRAKINNNNIAVHNVSVKQEADDMDNSQCTHINGNHTLLEPINSISVTVWDQFQEACNLPLQKEYVGDFCGFNHLNSLY